MKRSVWVLAVMVGVLAFGCSSKKTTVVADVPDVAAVADVPAVDVPVTPDVVDTERVAEDPGAPDLGPEDPGPPDLGPVDPGPPDLGPVDPGPPDLGPVDPGPPDLGPQDPGEQLSDTVAACIYVMENICAKALTKCDVLHLIPATWMQSCTDFLVGQHATLRSGCETLDNANSTDPNVQLIQSMGPQMLQSCVDNFECTTQNILAVYGVLQPIIGGQKLNVGDVVGVVANLCF